MKKGLQVLAMGVLLAAPLAAQTLPSTAPQRPTPAQVATFERTLLRAVSSGALNVVRQVRQVAPQPGYELSGAPDVAAFPLKPYGGLFVHVRVPAIKPHVALLLRLSDPSQTRMVVAGPRPGPGATAPPPAPFIDPDLLRDPVAVYTREVAAHIIDAILDGTRGLGIGADEFLTVAARDNTPLDLLDPADTEVQTIQFQIKGSDLAAYHSGAISLDEARTRVILTED